MGLTEILKEQAVIGFTGRINALSADNRRYLGVILFSEGTIVSAEYKNAKGPRSLYKLFLDDFATSEPIHFVVEPEVVSFSQHLFSLSFEEFKKQAEDLIEKARKSHDLRPPMNIKLTVNGAFITDGASLTGEEFSVLCTISDYNNIKQIYDSSHLYEFEVTEALISLRKKGALKVVA
jgi:hypothetical protein